MAETVNAAELLAGFTDRLLRMTVTAVEDLSPDEVHYRTHERMNCIGFDVWHIGRTADNLIHFAFEREQPVWLAQGLNDAWGLPKIDQGTGMPQEEAAELRFPSGTALAQYTRDVQSAIVPRIRAMNDEYLLETTTIRPQGEMSKWEIIGQVIINHGNNHLGQIGLSRTLQDREGLGF